MPNSIADYWRDKLAGQLAADRGGVPGDRGSKAAGTFTVGTIPPDTVLTAEEMSKLMRTAIDGYHKNVMQPPVPYGIHPVQAKHEPWKTMLATGRAFVMSPLPLSNRIVGHSISRILYDDVLDLGTDEEPDKPQPQGKAFTMSQTGAIHPPPAEFTAEEIQQDPILRFFHYTQLPPVLQEQSKPFAQHARRIIDTVPRSAERTAGLRKLLEAKDCIVRSMI